MGHLPREQILLSLFLLSTWCCYCGEAQSVSPLLDSTSGPSQLKSTTEIGILGTLPKIVTKTSIRMNPERPITTTKDIPPNAAFSINSIGVSPVSLTKQTMKDSTQAIALNTSFGKTTLAAKEEVTSSAYTKSMDLNQSSTSTLLSASKGTSPAPFGLSQTRSVTSNKPITKPLQVTQVTPRPTMDSVAKTTGNLETNNSMSTSDNPQRTLAASFMQYSPLTPTRPGSSTTRLLEASLSMQATTRKTTMDRTSTGRNISTKTKTEPADRTTSLQVTTHPVITTSINPLSVSPTSKGSTIKHVATRPVSTIKLTTKSTASAASRPASTARTIKRFSSPTSTTDSSTTDRLTQPLVISLTESTTPSLRITTKTTTLKTLTTDKTTRPLGIISTEPRTPSMQITTKTRSTTSESPTTDKSTHRLSIMPTGPKTSSRGSSTKTTTFESVTTDKTTHPLVITPSESTTPSRLTTTKTLTTTTEMSTTPFPCPPECACDASLKLVDCQHSTLSSIPTAVSTSTETLRLVGVGLSSLADGSFLHLPELKTLEITDNPLSSISTAAFRGLNRLQVLELNDNEISIISGTWTELKNLSTLDLSSNLLGDNSVQFDGLENLTALYLASNQLVTISTPLLAPLVNLELLVLSYNLLLGGIEMDAFLHNSRMKEVRIAYANLGEIQSNTFKHLSSLEKLDLSGNPLTTLPARGFEDLHKLFELTLASCKISKLDYLAFAGLDKLRLVTLYNNDLDSLSTIVFEPVGLLEYLTVGNNPWNCDCAMGELWDWLSAHPDIKVTDTDQMQCSSPDHTTGQLVSTLDPASFACQPYILNVPSEFEVVIKNQGDNVELDCVVIGEPPLSIYWETPVGNFTQPSFAGRFLILESSADLILVDLQPGDSGSYYCAAYNNYGVARAEYQLTVNPLPRTTISRDTTATTHSPSKSSPHQTLPEPKEVTSEESAVDCPNPLLSTIVTTEIDTNSFKLHWGSCNSCDFQNLMSYIIVGSVFGEAMQNIYGTTVPTTNNFVMMDLDPGTGYTVCILLEIFQCPLVTLYDNCVQVTTSGGPEEVQQDEIDELNQKHLYEIIGTFIATLLVTLLIMSSIFLLYWRCKRPKRVTKYSFLDPKSSSPGSGGGSGYDDYTTPITLNDLVNMEAQQQSLAATSLPSSPSTSGYDNKAATTSENYPQGLKRYSKFFEKIDIEDNGFPVEGALVDETAIRKTRGKSNGKGPNSKIKRGKPAAEDKLPEPILEREAFTTALQMESDTNSSEVSSSQSKGKDSPPPGYQSAIEMNDRSQKGKSAEKTEDCADQREEGDLKNKEIGSENLNIEGKISENKNAVNHNVSDLDPEVTGARPKVGVTVKKEDSDISVTFL